MASTSTTRGTEVRELGEEELLTLLRESKEELFNLRFQVATGQLDNNQRLRAVRRDIARIYTVMRERELGITYTPVEADTSSTAATKSTDESVES